MAPGWPYNSCMFTVLALTLLADPVSGDAVIRAKHGGSEIVVTTTSRLAGAVHSLTWNGVEFINSTDHGRQLQSACAFDCGKKPFWAEAYNPTEAGSRKDHIGPTSTSKLISISKTATVLTTKTQMAFWLNPGEVSKDVTKKIDHPALNAKPLSDHVLTKKITLNPDTTSQVIDYEVTFTVPAGESHKFAQFEALTGYMPPKFATFETWNAKLGRLEPLSDGPGEQKAPVVFSTADGGHAMGIFANKPDKDGVAGPSYGRWKFKAEKVVKWNCVYRLANAVEVPPGDYTFRMAVLVGTRDDVVRGLAALNTVK
jgi:hypothetical protein